MSEVLRPAGSLGHFSEGSLGAALEAQLEGRSRNWEDLLEVKVGDMRVAYFQIGKVKVDQAFGRQGVRRWLSEKEINTAEDLLNLSQEKLEFGQGKQEAARDFQKGINRLRDTILAGPGGVMVSYAFGRPVEAVSVEAEVLREQMIKAFMEEYGAYKFRKVGSDYFGWETGVMLHRKVVAPMNNLKAEGVNSYLQTLRDKLRGFHKDLWQYVPFRLDSLGRGTGENNFFDLLVNRGGHLGWMNVGESKAEEKVPVAFHRALRSVYKLPYMIRPRMEHLLNVRREEFGEFYGVYEQMERYLQDLFNY